jgi:3-hydroxyisobutyrate dehydrogenase-like beta-hydroxyacid dehydrogenase
MQINYFKFYLLQVPHVGPKSPADNNYQPGFSTNLMLKDLSIALEARQLVKLSALLNVGIQIDSFG